MPPFLRTAPAALATAVGPSASHKKPPVAMSRPARYAPSTGASRVTRARVRVRVQAATPVAGIADRLAQDGYCEVSTQETQKTHKSQHKRRPLHRALMVQLR